MQTFLPYKSFERTAKVLDGKRLNNQCNEGLVILRTCLGVSDGWQHHPTVKMWRGYEPCLATYIIAIAAECKRRWGNEDAWQRRMDKLFLLVPDHLKSDIVQKPPWLGDAAFHKAHRQALLAKLPDHYRRFWPEEEARIAYVWPAGKDNAP